MAAFPVGPNSLKTQRDLLRNHIKRLQAAVALADSWTEALERDRILVAPIDEAAFDAAHLPLATALASSLGTESNILLIDSLAFKVPDAIEIQT